MNHKIFNVRKFFEELLEAIFNPSFIADILIHNLKIYIKMFIFKFSTI